MRAVRIRAFASDAIFHGVAEVFGIARFTRRFYNIKALTRPCRETLSYFHKF